MKVEIINHSGQRIISEKVLKSWLRYIFRELKKCRFKNLDSSIVLAFVKESHIRQLNLSLRNKNKVTDVLSFQGEEGSRQLGELALCPTYIRKKSKQCSMSVREYTFYMILHGVLHLLGMEHEGSQKKAQEMFQLQDQVFQNLKKFI